MRRTTALALALAMTISACGGSADESASAAPVVVQAEQEQPTTLDSAAADETDTSDAATDTSGTAGTAQSGTDDAADLTEATDEERALEFARCMRDNGVDFPDPAIAPDGSVDLLGNAPPGTIDPNSSGFAAAVEVCGEIVAGASFLPGADIDPTQAQESLLAFAECLRGLGYDVIDPILSDIQGGGPGALVRAFGENFNPADPANADAVQECQGQIAAASDE